MDHHLIAKAERTATGANIHNVRNMLHVYVGYATLLPDFPAIQDRVEELERFIRIFCLTGEYDSGWRENALVIKNLVTNSQSLCKV